MGGGEGVNFKKQPSVEKKKKTKSKKEVKENMMDKKRKVCKKL